MIMSRKASAHIKLTGYYAKNVFLGNILPICFVIIIALFISADFRIKLLIIGETWTKVKV